MTMTTILIISAIVSAFLLFGGMLAWGDLYSRGVSRDPSATPERASPVESSASPDYREAA